MATRTIKPPPLVSASDDTRPLLKVCKLLNEAGARYLVAGAYAMILHSVIRATEDVDILIERSADNYEKVIAGLSGLADGAARELRPEDFEEHVVIKIADEVEVDVMTSAWQVTYEQAFEAAEVTVIDSVTIPFLSLRDLIRSKESYREQDRVDLLNLRRLKDA